MPYYISLKKKGTVISVALKHIAEHTQCFTEPLIPSEDLISNSFYCLTYNSYDVNLENLVLDPLIIPQLMFSFILITTMLYIVLIL